MPHPSPAVPLCLLHRLIPVPGCYPRPSRSRLFHSSRAPDVSAPPSLLHRSPRHQATAHTQSSQSAPFFPNIPQKCLPLPSQSSLQHPRSLPAPASPLCPNSPNTPHHCLPTFPICLPFQSASQHPRLLRLPHHLGSLLFPVFPVCPTAPLPGPHPSHSLLSLPHHPRPVPHPQSFPYAGLSPSTPDKCPPGLPHCPPIPQTVASPQSFSQPPNTPDQCLPPSLCSLPHSPDRHPSVSLHPGKPQAC